MNRDVLETQWPQVREVIRDKFSNLTEEDIRQINGRYDQLVAKLQQKYGYTREEAEERIRNWNFDRFANSSRTYIREDKVRREENNWSLLKWLAIGIPLLLLAAYLFSPTRTPETTMTQEQMIIETPADRAISSGIRNSLISEQNMGFELQNVQITTRNGIVTLSGTVPNNTVRNSIVDTAENFAGVRQVINNLQVR